MNFRDSLARYILENITAEIYERGLDYANAHKVKYVDESDKKLIASVVGSKIYKVEFRQGPKYMKAYCDCPYGVSNNDYCKHIVAVAIVFDRLRNTQLPEAKDIQNLTIEVDKGIWKRIDQMFANPLEADLELLAKASDYSPWGTKPHAKISVHSTIENRAKNLTTQELIKGFKSISKIMARYNFHHYFCAGEISAIFAKTLDAILFRLDYTQARIALRIFELYVISSMRI